MAGTRSQGGYRYQEALQQLIEAKTKGLTIKPRAVSTPSPVIDLMAALKRSLAQEPSAPEQETAKRRRSKQQSRHGPANQLARQLVATGLSDRPMVIRYRGLAGTMTYRSFHASRCGRHRLLNGDPTRRWYNFPHPQRGPYS
jgi:hypothetical protein